MIKQKINKIIMTVMGAATVITPLAGATAPVPDKIAGTIADKQDFQQPDCLHLTGWIGSRIEANDKRWTDWDVWAHKYNLIGLVTYIRYTGNMEALSACRKLADLLCNTFGDQPGKRDIISAGHHVGMAPGSVLEPMGLLTFKVRIPAWCRESTVKVNGRPVDAKIGDDGYAAIKRIWAKSDKVELNFKLEPRVIVGDHKNVGKAAVMYGPLVLAADEALLGTNGLPLNAVSLSTDLTALAISPEPAPEALKSWPHAQVFHLNAVMRGLPKEIRLIPFAEAGSLGENYKVWLFQYAGSKGDLLLEGSESRSRQGNADGSINDGNVNTCVVTYDGQPAAEDWYAVTLEEPLMIARVLFAHGKIFHDGGWFEARAGKPRIQIQTRKDGGWEDAGELKDYPATTAASAGALPEGESFSCTLAAPVKVFAVRIIGKPGCGDDPKQAFSSCGDLQAFAK